MIGRMKQHMVRRAWRVATLGLLGAMAATLACAQALPQRNLLVEWRYTDAPISTPRPGQYASQDAATKAPVQSLQVLNGHEARLRLMRSVPVTQWQLGAHADTASLTTTWVDLGQGVVVQPRWPGGRQPVTLEVRARDTQPGADGPQGPIEQTEVSTTLRLPLGQWTTIGRQAPMPASRVKGSWGSADAADEREPMRLEVRITAP